MYIKPYISCLVHKTLRTTLKLFYILNVIFFQPQPCPHISIKHLVRVPVIHLTPNTVLLKQP